MLQGGGALVGGGEHQPQRLFQVALADEVLQRFWEEVPLVPTARVLVRNGIICLGGHIDNPPYLKVTALGRSRQRLIAIGRSREKLKRTNPRLVSWPRIRFSEVGDPVLRYNIYGN